ncbi:MAG: rRNA pseudouridine synthase [Bacteroidetes bacterium]|nr:rRNA pseudouridine synthase [Bacteroidota bacterium]
MEKRNFNTGRKPQSAKKNNTSFKKNFSDKKPRSFSDNKERRPYSDAPKRDYDKKTSRFSDNQERRPYSDAPKRDYDKKFSDKKPSRFSDNKERRPYSDAPKREYDKKFSDKKPFSKKSKEDFATHSKKGTAGEGKKTGSRFSDRGERAQFYAERNAKGRTKNYKKDYSKKKAPALTNADKGLTRLNKYIANAGICSRREADDLIKSGCVTVNGKTISELGYTIKEGDVVNYSGSRIKSQKNVYLLLNKPKDYITTSEDERGRKTVMELITGACKERIYPVGRLDRNTTGLLLFTNDGDLTKKLTHPTHQIEKLYHVYLDKNLKPSDFARLKEGLDLEDGFMKPDEVAYTGEGKREVGIKIHSGKNRIVRRMFEYIGYEVIKLDRVLFAGLTKKNLPRAKWRFLTEKEIAFLKMVK